MSEFSRKHSFDRRVNERYEACDDSVQVSPLGPFEKSCISRLLFFYAKMGSLKIAVFLILF